MKTTFVNPAVKSPQVTKTMLRNVPNVINPVIIPDTDIKNMSLKKQIQKASELAAMDIYLEF